jgi:DNA-binding LacI/PurR family transcriptional regulator
MESASYPIVLVGDDGGKGTLYSVDVDHAYGMSELVKYLNRLGHRKLAYISGPELESPSVDRLSGYLRTLAELGLESREEWVVTSDWTNEGGYRAMLSLIETGEITAVLSSNDEMAVGAFHAAREKGLTLPGDFSITGYDDINIAKWVYPPLTTVRQPFYEIGKKAAEGLFGSIQGVESPEGLRFRLKPEIVIRESCAPAAGEEVRGRQSCM